MRLIRTIIVDDEWLIRSELAGMLKKHPEIELVGQAADAEAARHLIHQSKPDLIFLDIQMPGETGFQLLDTLESSIPVVFISAYDHLVPLSKRYQPVGFLLKPISPQKMESVLHQVFCRYNQV